MTGHGLSSARRGGDAEKACHLLISTELSLRSPGGRGRTQPDEWPLTKVAIPPNPVLLLVPTPSDLSHKELPHLFARAVNSRAVTAKSHNREDSLAAP